MSGKFRQRNFKSLEVGKTYIADFTGARVKIVSFEKGYFVGDDEVRYTKTGNVASRVNKFDIGQTALRFADLVLLLTDEQQLL